MIQTTLHSWQFITSILTVRELMVVEVAIRAVISKESPSPLRKALIRLVTTSVHQSLISFGVHHLSFIALWPPISSHGASS